MFDLYLQTHRETFKSVLVQDTSFSHLIKSEPFCDLPLHQFQCPLCLRNYLKESDMKRLKGLDERRKPISERLEPVSVHTRRMQWQLTAPLTV